MSGVLVQSGKGDTETDTQRERMRRHKQGEGPTGRPSCWGHIEGQPLPRACCLSNKGGEGGPGRTVSPKIHVHPELMTISSPGNGVFTDALQRLSYPPWPVSCSEQVDTETHRREKLAAEVRVTLPPGKGHRGQWGRGAGVKWEQALPYRLRGTHSPATTFILDFEPPEL